MSRKSSFQDDDSQRSSKFMEALPMFDLPKLMFFDRDEYTSFESQYIQMKNDIPDQPSSFYKQLNVTLIYGDVEQLYLNSKMTPSMMVFMINYIYNEEALRGVSRPKIFVALLRILNPKKRIFDFLEEESQFLKVKQFDTNKHKYFCAVIFIRDRWVLIIASLKKKSAVIVDFKYDDAFSLVQMLELFTNIIQEAYEFDISSFSVEGVLFTAPEQTDAGCYIICYLSKFITGAPFDKIKFSSRERGQVKLTVLWLLFKMRALKPNEEDAQSDNLSHPSRLHSQFSLRKEVLSTSSSAASKYMKYVQFQIKKQDMAIQTPEFMMKNQSGLLRGILPKVETFQDWDFDPLEKPIIEEFGNKVADVIAVLDSKMKLALLQSNSNEYQYLLNVLKDKISTAENQKNISLDREGGKYKKSYAKSVASLSDKLLNGEYQNVLQKQNREQEIDDSNQTIRGLEEIIKESIDEVRQGVPLSQSKIEEASIVFGDKRPKNINREQNSYQEPDRRPVQGSQQQIYFGQGLGNSSKLIPQHSLSHLDNGEDIFVEQMNEEYKEEHPENLGGDILNDFDFQKKPLDAREQFEDIGNMTLENMREEESINSIDIEQKMNGGKFNAFLNSYDNSKNYLEQYNLYYDAKKYYELSNQMNQFKINMDKDNLEYKHILLKMQNGFNKQGRSIISNSANNRRSSNTSSSFGQSQVLPDTSLSSFANPNESKSAFVSPNSKSVFVNNSMSILSGNPFVQTSLYSASYDPAEQSTYKKLLNKKPTNYRMQTSQQTQQITFEKNLQVVKSKTNTLQDIGRQSLQMRREEGSSGQKIQLEEILKQRAKYTRQRKEGEPSLASDQSDYESKGKQLENPYKISIDYAMLTKMLQKEFISEEIVNFCMQYFQQKCDLGGKDLSRLQYYKRMLLLPSDFYFVLTYDIAKRSDTMHYNLVYNRNENLNYNMIRPYYESKGNIFEIFDKIIFPICIRHTTDIFNEVHLEYQLVVADVNEKTLHLYIFLRDNQIAKELQHNAILTNLMKWFEYEYQWVFIKDFDPQNWKVVKGLTATTAEVDKTGYYLIYAVGQIILGFTQFENTTLNAIKNVKQNVAETLVKVANDYSIDKQPIQDFLRLPL